MPVAAMFQCQQVTQYPGWTDSITQEEVCRMEVRLTPVMTTQGSGNEDWSKATPAGELTMTITNPQVEGFFVPGKDYRLLITERQPQKARGGAEDNLGEADTSDG